MVVNGQQWRRIGQNYYCWPCRIIWKRVRPILTILKSFQNDYFLPFLEKNVKNCHFNFSLNDQNGSLTHSNGPASPKISFAPSPSTPTHPACTHPSQNREKNRFFFKLAELPADMLDSGTSKIARCLPNVAVNGQKWNQRGHK